MTTVKDLLNDMYEDIASEQERRDGFIKESIIDEYVEKIKTLLLRSIG